MHVSRPTFVFLLIVSFFHSYTCFTQNKVTLDVNNISLTQWEVATIGFNTDNYSDRFVIAPSGSGLSPMYAAFFWFRGIDIYHENRVFAGYYFNDKLPFTGPIHHPVLHMEDEASFYATYNRSWLVTRAEIDAFKSNRGNAGYIIPEAILSWPGNGDTTIGVAERLAPYADANGDGRYEPLDGDYPIIRGDAAIYQMMNLNAETGDRYYKKMGLEIHTMIYAYADGPASLLGNTIFVHNTIINREGFDYLEFQPGLYIDFDLGHYNDDQTGCDSILNLSYVYNGDDYDGPDSLAYGNMIPSFGIQQLSHPMYACGFNSIDAYLFNGYWYEFQYFMQGFWPLHPANYYDTPFTYGGSGYNGVTPTKYLLSSPPDDPEGWSMETEGYPPSDRNSMSSSSIVPLANGDTLCTEFAMLFAPATIPNDRFHSVNKLFQYAAQLQAMYPALHNGEDCITYQKEPWQANAADGITFLPYPNPSENTIWLNTGPFHHTNLILELRDMTGKLVARSMFSDILENQVIAYNLPELSAGQYLLTGKVNGYYFSHLVQVK